MRQRKINDEVLLAMLKDGKSQKACAEHFGVSEPAITKKLKRLTPPPNRLMKLTAKEQNFVIAVAQGKSRIAACMDAFDVSSRASAKALQNTLMQKDDIKIAVADLMGIYGLTRGYRMHKLKSHIDHVDPGVSLKGLDMSFKLDGLYAPEKHLNANFDVHVMSAQLEELKAKRAALDLITQQEGES